MGCCQSTRRTRDGSPETSKPGAPTYQGYITPDVSVSRASRSRHSVHTSAEHDMSERSQRAIYALSCLPARSPYTETGRWTLVQQDEKEFSVRFPRSREASHRGVKPSFGLVALHDTADKHANSSIFSGANAKPTPSALSSTLLLNEVASALLRSEPPISTSEPHLHPKEHPKEHPKGRTSVDISTGGETSSSSYPGWSNSEPSILNVQRAKISHQGSLSSLLSIERMQVLKWSTEATVWRADLNETIDLRDPVELDRYLRWAGGVVKSAQGLSKDNSMSSLDDLVGLSMEGTPVQRQPSASGGRMVVHSIFEKVRKLGSGSFGTVLLAENVTTRQMFAVKILDKERLRRKRFGLMATALERCELEVQIHKRLHHRNVVRLYTVIDDMGSDKLILFLEHMVHGPVQSPEMPVKLPEVRCQEVVTDVLHALRYLHRRGVVHNDIKPENILVGQNFSAKLTDFGASQLFEEGQPCTMLRSPGTPGFTAPECLTEDSYDGRAADMWALGISLYMLLTGRLPHQTNQISQLYNEIQTQEVRVPEFPEADAFLQGLLAKDPRERLTAETALQHPWVDHTGADRWEDSDSHSVRSSASGFGSARSDVGQGRRDHTDELDGAETLVASV